MAAQRIAAGDLSGELPREGRDEVSAFIASLADMQVSLRRLVGLGPEHPVLLASRSAQLMRLAARLLFMRCRYPSRYAARSAR